MTEPMRTPGPTQDAHNMGEDIKVYRTGDTYPCCGCTYVDHGGAETGPCTCRCHDAARIAATLPGGEAA